MAAEQVYWDDVDAGDEIGPMLREPTREQIRAYAASGGVAPNQGRFASDEGAKSEGLSNMIVPGNMSMSYLSQLLTDWAGPLGKLRRLEVNFRRMVNPGDQIACNGLVIDKDEVDGEAHVRIDVSVDNQRGEKPVVGTAVIALPKRG
ncbi:MAG: MaoC/PaaZ C-terminal domain-containing protein [Chloroflexi bacterium]|nr:MaoC/PaaZ C-terminal domain-containing protein [Chloroflexota bacterium]